jgi:TDG/mug DNA glycosylase family protein
VKARSFRPIVGRSPKVLILGSLPGTASLRLNQYYGHPQNKFWDLLGDALGTDLRGLTYARRLGRLKAEGIALWDIVKEARRRGSLDANIRESRHTLVGEFIKARRIKAVFCNGSTAYALYRKQYGLLDDVDVFLLPSSSPANASIPLAAKRRAWRRIRAYL